MHSCNKKAWNQVNFREIQKQRRATFISAHGRVLYKDVAKMQRLENLLSRCIPSQEDLLSPDPNPISASDVVGHINASTHKYYFKIGFNNLPMMHSSLLRSVIREHHGGRKAKVTSRNIHPNNKSSNIFKLKKLLQEKECVCRRC